MPITCSVPVPNPSESEFLARDKIVMRCAYASQNALGRLCDEKVYENDLADRLRFSGLPNVLTQVPIIVRHGDFEKVYRLDLLADGAVYELKTVEQYAGAHFSQIYNYAMCLDIKFIKLLNFRPSKVDGKMRASPFTSAIRHAVQVITTNFKPCSARCPVVQDCLQSLVADIGGFLEVSLYDEALGALTNAPEVRLIVARNGFELGTHPLRMIAEHVGFHVSSFSENVRHQQSHLERLLAMLPLKALHWINFNRDQVSLTTLTK
jgi:GxxExxY protein